MTVWFLLLPILILFSFFSLLPNVLDPYFCKDRKTHTCLERCRHPVTHSPLIFLLLSFILSLIPLDFTEYRLFIWFFVVSYGSHLFLDIFSHEGLPLLFRPSLFLQDHAKNYLFDFHSKPRPRLRLLSDKVLRNDLQINHRICLGCKVIVLLIGFQLIVEMSKTNFDLQLLLNAILRLFSSMMRSSL